MVRGAVRVETLRLKHAAMASLFTERSRRVGAGSEARALGYGGIAQVVRATGISRATMQRGLRELAADAPLAPERIRKPGAGRKRTTALDPTWLADLDALVEPTAVNIPIAMPSSGTSPRPCAVSRRSSSRRSRWTRGGAPAGRHNRTRTEPGRIPGSLVPLPRVLR